MLVVEHCIGRPHHLSCYLCCLCFVCHHFSLSATILPVLSDCQIINWNIPSLPATQMQIVGTPRSSASCSSHWSMSPAIDWSLIAEKGKWKMSTKRATHTCPSFSASLSEYLLGEPRFVSIPVSCLNAFSVVFNTLSNAIHPVAAQDSSKKDRPILLINGEKGL